MALKEWVCLNRQGAKGADQLFTLAFDLNDSLSLSVHFPTMTDGQNQDNDLFILNVTQHPVVSDSIPPESGPVAFQRFSEVPGVFAPLNSIIEPIENSLLNRPVQFSQLPFRHITDINCPSQVLFSAVLMA